MAEVTLVAYGDFACPACARTYLIVKQIQAKMGARLRYVFRTFPQPDEHGNSENAAEAAECASNQGRFWEMHDRLFESQGASDELQLARHATKIGLDLGQFLRDMNAHVNLAEIHARRRAGGRRGVVATPTFFINSVRHESDFGLATLLPAVQAAAGGA
jgi:protein-disulfide isomerase